MPLVYGVYAPNAPFLISPAAFGGVGKEALDQLRSLDIVRRFSPDTILVASPHWVSRSRFLVQDSARPRQVYDFSGFPPELGAVKYEPQGNPELAHRLVHEGKARHIEVEATQEWGIDHGAWAPLMHLAPGATVPVVPLSISTGDAELHLAWGGAIGAALASIEERVVFVSTGSITHAFDRFNPNSKSTWQEGETIENEVIELILSRKYEELAHFDRRKWGLIQPEGELGPLFIMAGALGPRFLPRLVGGGQVWGGFRNVRP